MNDMVATKAQDTPTSVTSSQARRNDRDQGCRISSGPAVLCRTKGRTYDRSRPKRSDRRNPLAKRPSTYDGFEPTVPRFWKGDLNTHRLAVVTHRLYTERRGERGLGYWDKPRTVHMIDERLDEVQIIDIDQGDAAKARDAAVMVEGEDAPVTKALHDLHAHLNTLWETGAMREGTPFEAMRNTALDWFASEEARDAQRHAKTPAIAEAIAFGRSLVTGHAFLARYPEASKGGRFLGYRLVLPVIPGSVLMDGSSDIDGVNQIATWRAPVKPPGVSFDRLSIKHIPFPVVDPDGYKKTVAHIMESADLSRRYAKWLMATVLAETEPGEHVLVITHRNLIDQERLPKHLTFDDPLVMEDGRKVAFLTYGRGIGSNSFKVATTVVVAGEFYRPHRVTMGLFSELCERHRRSSLPRRNGEREDEALPLHDDQERSPAALDQAACDARGCPQLR